MELIGGNMIKEENFIVGLSSMSRKDEYKRRLIELLKKVSNCSFTVNNDKITITFTDMDSVFSIELVVVSVNINFEKLSGYAPNSILIADVLYELDRKRDILLSLIKTQDGG